MYKILLVDDHRAFRKEFMRLPFIKDNPYFEVSFEANDGMEALEIAKENKVDIIVSDIRMPIMNGIELLEALNTAGIKSTFIILSEYGTFEYAQKAMNLGAYGYLTKPVSNSDVESMLNKVKGDFDGKSIPTVTTETIDAIALKLLDNSDASNDLIASLIDGIDSSTKSYEIVNFINQFFSALQKRIFEYTPWLAPFVSKTLFTINENELFEDGCKAYTLKKVKTINDEINKFGFSLSPSSKIESIQGICIFILSNIMNPDLNSAYVADEFFFNKSYLSQLFKEKMSINMIKFITLAKMEYAKVMLEDKNTRISELSSSLNFENPDYFSSIFKKTYGISPAMYQKNRNS